MKLLSLILADLRAPRGESFIIRVLELLDAPAVRVPTPAIEAKAAPETGKELA